MQRRKHWLLSALVATVAGLALAGCGGDDGGDTAGTDTGGGQAASEQVLKWGLGSEFNLDPGLATDTTSSKILMNIFDPLVKLDKDLKAQPAAAESWDVKGPKVTYHLRTGMKWTNGDPVTAKDYEYSWKRALSPELASDYAYQLTGIKGATEYNECEKNCNALRDKVAIKATDDQTLEVTLTSEQPWFIAQSAHHVFLPVNQKAVEASPEQWTRPQNIVTNGAFKVEAAQPSASITLVKNEDWRDAANVALTRVEGRIIVDGTTAVQSFEAGEVDALDEQLPSEEIARLKETPEYELYPGLGTFYYGFNVKNITDVKQRQAMSLAIDRQSIIDNIAQGDQLPTTGFTPKGMPGFDVLNPKSPWQPPTADMEQAKQLMSEVANPKTKITLYLNDTPPNPDIAVAVQAAFKEIGIDSTIKSQEFAQYLEFLGPPPNKDVDVYRLGWVGDFVDAINFLDLWTCDSGNNNTNYCNKDYDATIKKAKSTIDNDARYKVYGEAEDILFGDNGDVPVMPIYFYTYPNLERENIKATFDVNLLNQTDLTSVVVTK